MKKHSPEYDLCTQTFIAYLQNGHVSILTKDGRDW